MICLHDRDRIASFFRNDPLLHVYSLGDLDDDYWPHTTWYGLTEGREISAAALLYSGLSTPTLVAIGQEHQMPALAELLRDALHLLPRRLYCHLSPGLSDVLRSAYRIQSRGPHYKMGLTDRGRLPNERSPAVVRSSVADFPVLESFYALSYPGNWFEARMLESGQYYAIQGPRGPISAGGVHVYSPRFRVAALGTIATHPDYRGRGYAKAVVGELCRNLACRVDHIGLNVKADNQAAIRCYEALGFQVIGSYEECTAEL